MANKWTDRALGCGCVTGLAFIVLMIVLPMFAQPFSGYRPSCQNNLKQIGLSLRWYANEAPGQVYPTLPAQVGRLSFMAEELFPEYIPDTRIMLCPDGNETLERLLTDPSNPYSEPRDGLTMVDFIDDHSYFYLGFAILGDADMEAFARAYRYYADRDEQMAENVYLGSDDGEPTLFRLRVGVEHDLLADGRLPGSAPPRNISPVPGDPGTSAWMQSEIPLVIERVGNHTPDGANVLYLDGHVEFIHYPGKWPMTESTVRILNELDALGKGNPSTLPTPNQ